MERNEAEQAVCAERSANFASTNTFWEDDKRAFVITRLLPSSKCKSHLSLEGQFLWRERVQIFQDTSQMTSAVRLDWSHGRPRTHGSNAARLIRAAGRRVR
nr:hypothetical protein CFP56_67607 [Quercus suber]